MQIRNMVVAPLAVMIGAGFITDVAYSRNLTLQEKTMIREAVTKDFRDSDSAKFKWLPLMDRTEWLPDQDHPGRSKFLSCGLVNAKNSFGGHTGYTPYAVGLTVDGSKVLAVELVGIAEGSDAQADFIPALCKKSHQDTESAR